MSFDGNLIHNTELKINLHHGKTLCNFFTFLILFSCISTRLLDGGKGNKAPYKGYKFTNKKNFDSYIYNEINPAYFYECIDKY
ncbi:hypothetical protein [Apibacter adventoris]|uniref:hypothetical protein n=1 Tax=Apibacter adventoris TaxID=1679466 RepID=UPI000CF5F3CC|nr:hypothetical protein [Apibacter adventoris]PQL94405.1 hypothetical protein C4S76_05915 [Apibacter adventoris]